MVEVQEQAGKVVEEQAGKLLKEGVNVVSTVIQGEVKDEGEEEPNMLWTLEKLKDYIQSRGKRMAKDVWLLGRALMFAKRQCKKHKMPWETWVAENCSEIGSLSTVKRYVELARLYSAYADIEKDGIREAYIKAGIIREGKKIAKPTGKTKVEKEATTQEKGEAAKEIAKEPEIKADQTHAVSFVPKELETEKSQSAVEEDEDWGTDESKVAGERDVTREHNLVLAALEIVKRINDSLRMETTLKNDIRALQDILTELNEAYLQHFHDE